MKIVNSWKSPSKQVDKVVIELRIMTLTVFKFNLDISDKRIAIVLFNLGITN